MKRLWVIFLSICMLMSLTVPALAAPAQTSGAASTLKLESVDGTATLKDGGGKTLKTTNGSRLYNGYELATKKASYAYVSLDDTKAIKLDASTSTEVFQSGKKLEMKVNSGQMFFNVTAPLKSNESLNIRTSTMVTGVRGTSGWVEVVSRYITRVSLLEGELTITSVDPLTNVTRSVTIYAGQTATVVHHGEGKEYKSEIIVDGSVIGGGSGNSSSSGSTSGSDTSSGSGSTSGSGTNSGSGSSSGSGTSSGSGSSSGSGTSSGSGSSSGSGTSSGSGSSSGSGATSGSGSSSGSSVGSGIIGVPEIGADEEETIENLIEGGVIQEEHIVTNYPGLTVETLQEEDVPGFVAVEVEKDEELQQRIEENSPLSVPEIIGNAEERLEAEEAVAEEQDQLIQDAVDQLIAEEVDPLFKEESTSGSSSSSGGSSSGSTTPTPGATYYGLTIQYGYLNARNVFTRIPNVMETVSNIEEGQPYDASAPVTVDGYVYTGTIHTDSDPLTGTMDSNKTVRQLYLSTTLNLVNPTSTEMADALATFEPYLGYMGTQRATLNVSGTISNDGTTTTMVVPSYFDVNVTTASLSSGLTLDTEADSTLNFNDDFTNSGTISGEGTMTVADGKTLTNSGGTILIENTNSMHVYGTLNNLGQILVGSADKAGKLVIEKTGTLENNRQLTVASGSIFTVYNNLTNDGTISILAGGSADLNSSGAMTTSTAISNAGTMTVSGGTITGTAGGSTITNTGSLTVSSGTVAYTAASGSAIDNQGGTVSITGGTVSATGAGSTPINGDFTYTGGSLDSTDNSVFERMESTVEIPQASVSNGTYTVDLSGDTSVRTFDTTATNAQLAHAAGLSYVKTIHLTAGGSIDTTSIALRDDQTLNVNGGNLIISYGYGLSGGTVNVANAAVVENSGDVTVSTAMEITGTAMFINYGSLSVENGGELTLSSSNMLGLDNQAGAQLTLLGDLTTSSGSVVSNGGTIETGETASITLSGALNNVYYTGGFGEIYISGTMTTESGSTIDNLGSFNVTAGGTLALSGNLNNNYDAVDNVYGSVNIYGTITSETTSTITNTGGYFTFANAASADAAAAAAAASTLKGKFVNAADSGAVPGSLYVGTRETDASYNTTITSFGGVTFAGTLDNLGEILVEAGSVVDSTGTVNNNSGTSTAGGIIRGKICVYEFSDTDSDVFYQGLFNMKGSSAAMNNDAEFKLDGGILNIYGGTLNNLAYIYDDTVSTDDPISGGYIIVGGGAGDLNIHTSAKMINRGELEVNVPESAHVYGRLDNYGYIFLGGSQGRLYVEESGTLYNFSDAVIAINKGRLYVAGTLTNFSGAAIYNGERQTLGRGGLLSITGRIDNYGTLINDENGRLLVGDWADADAETPTDFRPGTLNNYEPGLLDNRTGGTLYISPASVLNNNHSLYNTGTIQLGTADGKWFGIALDTASMAEPQLINGNADADPTDTTDNIWNGYAMVGLDESQNELIEESSGTLNLYSGKLINYGYMHNAASNTANGITGGTIVGFVTDEYGNQVTSNATLVNYGTFTNYNSSFSPSLDNIRFSNQDNGKYVDKTSNTEG